MGMPHVAQLQHSDRNNSLPANVAHHANGIFQQFYPKRSMDPAALRTHCGRLSGKAAQERG